MTSPTTKAGEMAVVVTAGPLRERIDRVLAALAGQTIASELEVIISDHAPEAEPIGIPAGVRATVMPADGLTMYGGRAAAIRRAEAPVIALLEDHTYPVRGWAEAVLGRHRAGWDAVGYAVAAPHADSPAGRYGVLTEYVRTMHPAVAGEVGSLPAHAVSYRRSALEALGDELDACLAGTLEMGAAFAARGLRMFLEPEAVVEHEFFSRLRDLAGVNFVHGRLLGGLRSRRWGGPRRLVWALGTPLSAPAVRAARLLEALRSRGARPWREIAPGLSVIATAYLAEALGESLGYMLGPGDAEEALHHWELARPRFAADSAALSR